MYKILLCCLLLLEVKAFSQSGSMQTITQFGNFNGTAFGNDYTRQNLYSFGEYGISKTVSMGWNTNLARIDSTYKSGTIQYAVFGPEFYYRHKVLSKNQYGLVIHNAVKLPSFYDTNKHLGLMPKQWDYELRLIALDNFKERLIGTVIHNSTPYFLRGEIAYRKRFSNPFDEARFTFWGGFDIHHNLSILVQNNATWNIQSNSGTNPLNNTYSHFSITRDAINITTISAIYRISNGMALQFGCVRKIHGNNLFYDSKGIIIGLWNTTEI